MKLKDNYDNNYNHYNNLQLTTYNLQLLTVNRQLKLATSFSKSPLILSIGGLK